MADGIIVLNQTLYGKEIQNVLVVSNMAASVSDFQEWADAIRADYVANVQGDLVTEWTLETVKFIIDPGPGQYSHLQDFSLGPLSGLETAQVLPNQTALLVSTSYLGPRPNRGRVYFAGLSENELGDGKWAAGTLADFENLVEDWATTGIIATGGTLFLRIGRRDAQGSITSSSPVDAVFAQPIPATQRRRRRAE